MLHQILVIVAGVSSAKIGESKLKRFHENMDFDGWLFGCLGFTAHQPVLGYSMPNPFYIYELDMIRNHFFI